MAQTLEQIMSSLGSVYDPQVQSVQAQQAQLPQQLQNDESALQGQQKGAFDSILNGARSRGTGVAFGGIPLGEQAQYTANTFLPAMANLRSTYATKGLSLQDAINGINEKRFNNAQELYQFGVQQDQQAAQMAEQQRQFNESQAQQKALAGAAGSFAPSFGGGGAGAPASADPYGSVNKQGAANAIVGLLKTNNAGTIKSTIDAINASARNGNLYDKYKLELLKNYQNSSQYGPLINKAYSYNATAAKTPIPVQQGNNTGRITF